MYILSEFWNYPPLLESLLTFFDKSFSKKLKMFPSIWFLFPLLLYSSLLWPFTPFPFNFSSPFQSYLTFSLRSILKVFPNFSNKSFFEKIENVPLYVIFIPFSTVFFPFMAFYFFFPFSKLFYFFIALTGLFWKSSPNISTTWNCDKIYAPGVMFHGVSFRIKQSKAAVKEINQKVDFIKSHFWKDRM